MAQIKVNIRDVVCGTCSASFSQDDIFYLEDGDYLCEKCFDTFEAGEENDYLCYFVDSGIGNLILDKASLQAIRNGIFCIKRTRDFLTVYNELSGRATMQYYLKYVIRDYFLLEKYKFKSVLIFSVYNRMDEEDFYENLDDFSWLIDRYKSICGCSKIYLVLNDDKQVVGLSDTPFSNLKAFNFSCCSIASDTIMVDQFKEKFSNDIGRCTRKFLKNYSPKLMLSYCQQRIQGQDKNLKAAVYQIYRYLQLVASNEDFTAQNWLLTAPSGCGKTEFYRCIRDFFKDYNITVPVVYIDLSLITEEGYKGTNSTAIPKTILEQNIKCEGRAICFLDEADKKCIPSYTSRNTNVNAAIQSNLLTLIEGNTMSTEVDDKSYMFDSSKTMFVMMGSFQSVRQEKIEKVNKQSKKLGFFSDNSGISPQQNERDEFFADITLEDMIDFGMQEELAGRLSQVVNFHKISKEDMSRLILIKAKEISKEIGVEIELTAKAQQDFLEVSYTNLGVRRPMNLIRELAQNAIAQIFFEKDIDLETTKIVITSAESAHVKSMEEKSCEKTKQNCQEI